MALTDPAGRGQRPPLAAGRPRPAGKARTRRLPGRLHRQLLGAAGMAVVAAITAVVILAYQQVFTPAVRATVIADRAGLLMYPGADVTLYGVTVGRVTSIEPDGRRARLAIALNPGQVSHIPANVHASIDAPTVFGPKFLNLVLPAHPAAQRIQPGQVIEPTAVPTEVNTLFASLVSVLESVHPAKVSATLGAISTALQGRGAQLGTFIAQLNSYLRAFNPSLPAVSADLAVTPKVLRTYASAAPDLIATAGNVRVTSGTLVRQQAQFDAFLIDLSGLAGNARTFLAGNERGLTATLATLAPTSALLGAYSPEFGCLFASGAQMERMSTTSEILLHSTILPGQRGYQYPANLPEVRAASGPSCYGGPLNAATAAHWPRVTFSDGTQNFFTHSNGLSPGSPPLDVLLFGKPAGGAAAKGGH